MGIEEAKMAHAVVNKRRVRDPMMTDAEYAHRRSLKPEDAEVGTIEVDVNMVTRIGGLARVAGIEEAQILAAARYRDLFDRKTLGGARATDYSALRVDTSGSSSTAVLEQGDDARRGYAEAVQALGLRRSSLVEKVVCHDMSIRQVARELGEGEGGAAQERVRRQLVEAIDVLVGHFRLEGQGPGRSSVRVDGDRPLTFHGIVSTRR